MKAILLPVLFLLSSVIPAQTMDGPQGPWTEGQSYGVEISGAAPNTTERIFITWEIDGEWTWEYYDIDIDGQGHGWFSMDTTGCTMIEAGFNGMGLSISRTVVPDTADLQTP